MPARLFHALFFGLILGSPLHAHQVPNMTVEAGFAGDGGYELKVNLDPRVFLSGNPASLPPVPASWFLDQSPEQRNTTFQQASAHIGRTLQFWLGGTALKDPAISWQALDGATNVAVSPDTAETHLLGTLKGVAPAGAGSFSLEYARDGQVSLILLTTTPGMDEPRVQVLFAGERSRPVTIPSAKPQPPPSPRTVQAAPPPQRSHWPAVLAVSALLAFIAGALRFKASR